MSYRNAVERMKEAGQRLQATDFGHEMVFLLLEDGSTFTWDHAFARHWHDPADGTDWLLVFTEHHGYHAFEDSDILRFAHAPIRHRTSEILPIRAGAATPDLTEDASEYRTAARSMATGLRERGEEEAATMIEGMAAVQTDLARSCARLIAEIEAFRSEAAGLGTGIEAVRLLADLADRLDRPAIRKVLADDPVDWDRLHAAALQSVALTDALEGVVETLTDRESREETADVRP